MLHLAQGEVAGRGGTRFHVAEGEACLVGSALMRQGVAAVGNTQAAVVCHDVVGLFVSYEHLA